jgi:hypothetical protein
VAQFQVTAQRVAAQVEVPVAHAELFAAVGFILNGERRYAGCVEHIELLNDDLDFAGRHFQVLVAAFDNFPGGKDDEFAAKLAGLHAEPGIGFHVKGQLSEAVAVAQVDKGHPAEVAGALHPAGKGYGLTGIREAKFATGVGSEHNVC